MHILKKITMKSKLTILKIAVIVFTFMALSSCKKEGCTDVLADNFDTKANSDDGTCLFSSSLSIWWDEAYADTMAVYGYTTVEVYMNNVFISSRSASTFWTGAPDCEDGINQAYDLETAKTGSVTVKIIEGGSSSFADFEATEVVSISANEVCTVYQWQ